MYHVVQRLGFRIPRGWAVFLLLMSALVVAAFWIGPFRPVPPELQLTAMSGDGQFRAQISLPSSWADTAPLSDAPARFPLVFAVSNQGDKAGTPVRLALSIPARFRLANHAGGEYEGKVSVGNPLVQYVFDIKPGRIEPGQPPRVLAALDTLWLEPVMPSYYCTALADSVPEFMPAPALNPRALSQVRIFYSFDARVRARQTGVLSVQLDPALLQRPPVPALPNVQVRMTEPEYLKPELGALRRAGSRSTRCGQPGSSLELYNVLWETPEGGRFFVIYNGATPRKYLFDLNRDSIIELEMWDPDGDGRFQAGRPTRMLIPEFLMPLRGMLVDSVTADIMRADSMQLDTTTLTTPVPQLNFEFPTSLFRDTERGPFRFHRALQQQTTGTSSDSTTRTAQPEPTRPADQPSPPVRAPRTVSPRTDSGPRLLGTPVPTARRDTIIRRDTLQ